MIYNIKQVHIEGSGRCNSRCPMCSRHTADGYVQPDLDELDLHPDVFYKLFTPELCSNLNHVYFSGVYGDPCMNKALPDFVEHFKTHDVDVAIDSNAGYRNTRWWARLGSMGTRVHFAIDGLEDTNHLYRRGVDWDKDRKNVKAFQEAGGNGAWTFIVFKHNEHQVKQAEILANSLGFKKFESIASTRWVLPDVKVLPTAYRNKINKSKNIVNATNKVLSIKNEFAHSSNSNGM